MFATFGSTKENPKKIITPHMYDVPINIQFKESDILDWDSPKKEYFAYNILGVTMKIIELDGPINVNGIYSKFQQFQLDISDYLMYYIVTALLELRSQRRINFISGRNPIVTQVKNQNTKSYGDRCPHCENEPCTCPRCPNCGEKANG